MVKVGFQEAPGGFYCQIRIRLAVGGDQVELGGHHFFASARKVLASAIMFSYSF